jgi:co-chaperonin GroES (HSP10)
MSRVCEPDELPGEPMGDRVLLLPDPPLTEAERGICIPELAQKRNSSGKLLAAGLRAMDKLYDHGVNIGDDVIWGQFAGILWEWNHIKEYSAKPCKDEHDWERRAQPRDRVSAWECGKCKTTRWCEVVLLANVDDIQSSVDLGQRKRNGVVAVRRGKTAEGQTMHFIERKDS